MSAAREKYDPTDDEQRTLDVLWYDAAQTVDEVAQALDEDYDAVQNVLQDLVAKALAAMQHAGGSKFTFYRLSTIEATPEDYHRLRDWLKVADHAAGVEGSNDAEHEALIDAIALVSELVKE